MDKIRIVYVLASLDVCNGMVSYAMNYFRNIDKNKFQIDFIINSNEKSPYYQEIIDNGSKVYIMPDLRIKNIFKLIRKVNKFFKKNRYDIIHCHIPNAGIFYLKSAKKYGVSKRILHSHATKSSDKFIKKLRNDLMIPFAKRYANINFACSKEAGEYLFNNKYIIIKNAINLQKYKYDNNIRDMKRKELNLEGKFVIGNVGRLSAQKNPLFMIEIFKEIYDRNNKSVLILIGDGPLEHSVKEKVKEFGLEEKVVFLANRTDVNELYQAMDVFVLPSLYEGVGIAYIEAQACGLNTFGSNMVPIEAEVTDKMRFIPLNASAKIWADKILNCDFNEERVSNIEMISKNGYDIKKEVINLENIYKSLLER